ncbi:DUF3267 domain-containing protein [Natronorubrum sp. FCH18a]|uniref:DUF3267 domain-containing protein n=1 Tax=Natronorubrum sp. FCH18a TaxID=3447018 RepID=UPI003F51318F
MSRTESHESPRPIATFRKTRSVAIQWAVVSAIGFFGFAYGFAHVLAAIRGVPLEPIVIPAFGPSDALVWIAASAGLVALVVLPHELLHGAFMARYGGSPTYGVGVSHFLLPYAYAETAGTSYTRNQLLVALLAPFVGITVVGLAAMVVYPSSLLVVPLAANAAGSIGDLWMAAVLWQYPANVRVSPLADGDAQGFGVYGSSDRDVDRGTGMRLLSTVAAGAVGTLAVCSTALIGAVFLSLAVGSGTVVLGDPGGRWLLFRHELYPHGTVVLEIGAASWLAVATLGGLGWAVIDECCRSIGAD